jgi:DNA replicative helicase MCM subunit Mcm2 (Cdc46/Mcm family)
MAKLCFRSQVNQADVDEAIKLMDFSIRSLRTLKAEANSGSKGRQATVREFKNSDRMSEVIKLVREAMSGGNQMKVGDILRAIGKNRMHSIGQLDREELLGVLNHYKKLQIIYIDDDENVLFL